LTWHTWMVLKAAQKEMTALVVLFLGLLGVLTRLRMARAQYSASGTGEKPVKMSCWRTQ